VNLLLAVLLRVVEYGDVTLADDVFVVELRGLCVKLELVLKAVA
jgi:hypothetical protein